eukprot:TRINITY_DN2663_c0_g1_i16.p1 TRINITY_DN2663_c0_g1~~TRINITY_DN2663_c0_g1_i16.p1  ORF type:complete len:1279 (-),score=483.63 TRINITY_DN2663_c0_g1_i16:1251-5087(-)
MKFPFFKRSTTPNATPNNSSESIIDHSSSSSPSISSIFSSRIESLSKDQPKCNQCLQFIPFSSSIHWFSCNECNFILCVDCHHLQNESISSSSDESNSNMNAHPHFLSKTFVNGSMAHFLISSQSNIKQCYLTCFAIYQDFPLFGICQQKEDPDSPTYSPLSNSTEERKRRNGKDYKKEKEENGMNRIVLQSSANSELQQFEWIRYGQFFHRSLYLSKSLSEVFGLKKGDFVGICANNCLEYFLYDLAFSLLELVCVPIPSNFEDSSLKFVVEDTQLKWIICEPSFTNRFQRFKEESNLPLSFIVELDQKNELESNSLPFDSKFSQFLEQRREGKGTNEKGDGHLVEIIQHSQFESFGRNSFIGSKEEDPLHKRISTLFELNEEERTREEEGKKDIYTIIFTSGSTGNPKGAVYSNEIWKKSIMSSEKSSFHPRVAVSFSPLYHLAGKRRAMGDWMLGGRIGILSTGMQNIFDELELLSPTHIGSTPRIWNVLYDQFQTELENYSIQNQLDKNSPQFLEFEKELLSIYSKKLGKRIRSIGSGGAPTSPQVLAFLKKCFKCGVSSGYGSTETGSVFSSGGIDLTKVEFKLEDVPELNYYSTDKPFPRGEILVKTKTMIEGYWNNPSLNESSFTSDGFFRTGDVVQLTGKNTIQIIDRKKAFFKLSQGEFIAPEKLEILYSKSKFIRQIFITGDTLQSFIVAIIVPNLQILRETLKREEGKEEMNNFNAICKSKKAKEILFKEFVSIAKEEHLATFEIPLRFQLRQEEFSVENGLLTSSHKIARNQCRIYFKDEVERLYNNTNEEKEFDIEREGYSNTNLFEMIVSQVLNCKQIGGGDNLVSLGMDSLAAVSIKSKLKEKTGLEIPMSLIFNANHIQEINQFIQDASHSTKSVSSNVIDWSFELNSLLEDSQIITKIKERYLNSSLKLASPTLPIFLTGVSGFLGAFLLKEIMKREECKVYCLIRVQRGNGKVDSSNLGMEKIKRNLNFYNLWEDSFEKRIEVVEGDLNLPRFGMDLEKFEQLGKLIGRIIHCASWVNTIFDYQTLKPSNVLGTIEALKLACMSNEHLTSFHLVSSISAAIGLEEDINQSLDEAEFEKASKMKGGYSLSKWMSERILIEAKRAGLLGIIYQPGTICGSLKDGSSNQSDYISMILSSMIEMKSIPEYPFLLKEERKEYSINITPVDTIASWITQSVQNTQKDPSLFNLSRIPMIHPKGNIEWLQIFKWIDSYLSHKVDKLAYSDWFSKLGKFVSHSSSPLNPFMSSLQNRLPTFRIGSCES